MIIASSAHSGQAAAAAAAAVLLQPVVAFLHIIQESLGQNGMWMWRVVERVQ